MGLLDECVKWIGCAGDKYCLFCCSVVETLILPIACTLYDSPLMAIPLLTCGELWNDIFIDLQSHSTSSCQAVLLQVISIGVLTVCDCGYDLPDVAAITLDLL